MTVTREDIVAIFEFVGGPDWYSLALLGLYPVLVVIVLLACALGVRIARRGRR